MDMKLMEKALKFEFLINSRWRNLNYYSLEFCSMGIFRAWVGDPVLR